MGRKNKISKPEPSEPSTPVEITEGQIPPPDPKIAAIINKKPIITALAQALGNIGIKEKYRKSLKKARVRSLRSLFLYAYNHKRRDMLSKYTGIDEALLVNWIGQADIFRIDGIGQAYASLLVAAGVDSPVELGQRSAQSLYETLIKVNHEKKIVHRPPTLAQVQKWIREAKSLKRIVEY